MSAPNTDPIIATHAQSSSPPYRFYVLMLLLAANTLSYADRHLFSILIPAIKEEFGASDSLMGLIGGPAFILSYVLLSMPLARLADRWSRRRVLALSATLWSLATAACGAAASVTQLALSRVIVGVGEAGGMPPSQSMIADLYDERRRSGALGVLASGTYFGLVLGLLGGAAVASVWGWRAAFFALALPGLPIALLVWLTGPRRVRIRLQMPPAAKRWRRQSAAVGQFPRSGCSRSASACSTSSVTPARSGCQPFSCAHTA